MAGAAMFWHTAGMARLSRLAGWCGAIALYALGIAAGLNGTLLVGQDTGVPTLHVYTNTIQIPVLVLGSNRQKIAPIAAKRFNVSFDGGPPFRASHVRVEGDDPISLAILLDMSGSEAQLLPKLAEATAMLAPLSLRPADHVSVYALDCVITRYTNDAPANQARLKAAVGEALQSWIDRGRGRHEAGCEKAVNLWDALALVTNQLSGLPGRRVVLAMSEGVDRGSTYKWNELRVFAQATAVAIFGMRYVPEDPMHLRLKDQPLEDAFDSVCELSGGVVFTASRNDVDHKMTQFVTMVRGRYIMEFPRPYNATKGQHELVVTIDHSDAFIRSTGISVPVANAELLADPTTVRPDPTLAPEEGKRRILMAPK
jgi:hypothetical protein